MARRFLISSIKHAWLGVFQTKRAKHAADLESIPLNAELFLGQRNGFQIKFGKVLLFVFLLIHSTASNAQNNACTRAHEVIVDTQQRLLTLKQQLEQFTQNPSNYSLDNIIAHEQALQQKYAAEISLFKVVASTYVDADSAHGRVKNFLISGGTDCLGVDNRKTTLQLWENFRKNPDQFGRLRQNVDINDKQTPQKIQQFEIIRSFINAEKALDGLAFDRFEAEKSLLETIAYQAAQEQQLRQALLKPERLEQLQDNAPKCFRRVKDDPNPVYNLQPLMQRAVPFDVYPTVKAAVCQLGVTDPNWLADRNLSILRQRLEVTTRLENNKDVQLWQQQRRNLSIYARSMQKYAPTVRNIKDPQERQKQAAALKERYARMLRLQELLSSQRPAALKQWQENRKRLQYFDSLVESAGLDRLAYHYNVNDQQRLQTLQQAEKTYRQNFISLPDNISNAATQFTTPRYLNGLLQFSRFHEQQLRNVISQLNDNDNTYFKAITCAVNKTIASNFQAIKPACLSEGDAVRLNRVSRAWLLGQE